MILEIPIYIADQINLMPNNADKMIPIISLVFLIGAAITFIIKLKKEKKDK